jgi:hypothetical protein
MGQTKDNVNHPEHYEANAVLLEPIDFCEKLGFCHGNFLKYVIRARSKGNELEDLQKAMWYWNRGLPQKKNIERFLAATQGSDDFFRYLGRSDNPLLEPFGHIGDPQPLAVNAAARFSLEHALDLTRLLVQCRINKLLGIDDGTGEEN